MVKVMSEQHKAANARARIENQAVQAYLEALARANVVKGKRGPRMSKEKIEARIEYLTTAISTAPPLKRIVMLQERRDLREKIAAQEETVDDLDALEADFVERAYEFSERKGISYLTWREYGIPAAVLRKAGIRLGDS